MGWGWKSLYKIHNASDLVIWGEISGVWKGLGGGTLIRTLNCFTLYR